MTMPTTAHNGPSFTVLGSLELICPKWPKHLTDLVDKPPNGVLKHGTPLCLLRLKACSVNLASDAGSMRQNDPFPGSSCERGTFTK